MMAIELVNIVALIISSIFIYCQDKTHSACPIKEKLKNITFVCKCECHSIRTIK